MKDCKNSDLSFAKLIDNNKRKSSYYHPSGASMNYRIQVRMATDAFQCFVNTGHKLSVKSFPLASVPPYGLMEFCLGFRMKSNLHE